MKFLILFLALLVGCSQSHNTTNPAILEDDTIEFQAVSISTSSSGVIPSASLDFASLAYLQSAKQSLIISNQSSAPLVFSAEDISSLMLAPFEIITNTCTGSIASRKKCSIEFKLSNPTELSSEQIISSSLIIKGATISLTGTLQAAPAPSATPDVSLSVSPTSLQFGTMIDSNISELSIIIKNNATVAKSVSLSSLTSNKITISSNTCPASLGARKTCTVKFRYSAAGNETIADQPLISISNYPILYSVIVDNPTTENPVVITSVEPVSPPLSITLTQPNAMQGSVSFKNNGSSTFAGPVSATASHPSITIASVSCPAGLVRGRTCVVNFSVNSPDAPLGISSQSIKLQSGTTASDAAILDFTISTPGPAVACSSLNESELQTLGYTTTHIATVSGNTPSCVIETCDPYYERAGGFEAKTCDAKLCGGLDSVELISLDYIDDGSGSIGYNPQEYLSGTYPNCALTCPSGFEPNPSNPKRCQVAAGAVACTLGNAAANGVTLANVASVRGTTPNCEVVSCSSAGLSPSIDLKSCSDSLSLIGSAHINLQNYGANAIFKLPNQDRIFFDIDGFYYDLGIPNGGHSLFFRQNGYAPGTSNLIEGFQAEIYSTLPELFNGNKIISQGQSYTIPEAPTVQIRTIDTSISNLPSQIIYEESQYAQISIDKLIRYQGSSNNDLLLMITRKSSGAAEPHTFKIMVSNSTLTELSTVLYESEDYQPTFGSEASNALASMSIGEPRQIGTKLFFSITRINASSNPSYELFVFDGTTVSIVTSQTGSEFVSYMGGSNFSRRGSAVSNSKYYEMINYLPSCSYDGFNPCFLNYYLIESDGNVMGTLYKESYNTTFLHPQVSTGNDFFVTAGANFNLDPQILGSDSNGVYYTWFTVGTNGGMYDYLNPPLGGGDPGGPGDPGLEGEDAPCEMFDYECTNIHFYQQIVNDQLKRVNNSGVSDVLLTGKTYYAYGFAMNPANFGRDYFMSMGSFNGEFYFVHTAPEIGKLYQTNGASSSLLLVEDLNATNNLNYSSALYPTSGSSLFNLKPDETILRLQNRIYKKVGAGNFQLMFTLNSSNYFRQKGDRLYFEEIDTNVPGFAKFLQYTDGTSIVNVYNYPNLNYSFDILDGDILIHQNQTRNLYILRPSIAE